MEITKLTITPILKGCGKIICKNPEMELATSLLKERFESPYYQTTVPRSVIRHQIPKSLRNFVNIDTLILK